MDEPIDQKVVEVKDVRGVVYRIQQLEVGGLSIAVTGHDLKSRPAYGGLIVQVDR